MIVNENTPIESAEKPKRFFYDADKIKEIPIVDVCQHFGIRIDYKGREPRCSIRLNDKTPSTVLHTDPQGKYKVNTYHDFGSNETGDVISLTCRQMGLDRSNNEDRYKAMEYLANVFHISPENREDRNPGELSDREYRLLGLYGDRATKNFNFDPDRQSIEQMSAISQKYNMTMNELKKEHPRIFERLIKTTAIPNLQEARNDYYMYIWGTRRFLRAVLGDKAEITDMKEFEDKANELRAMERTLTRAMIGTRLKAPAELDYDPIHILARIDSGDLKPNFGSKTYSQMKRIAEAGKTTIKYRALDLTAVFYRGQEYFRDIPYSAFLSKDKAMVGYLEKDTEALRPIFQELALPVKRKASQQKISHQLSDKLKDAQHRQSVQTAAALNQNIPQPER